MSVVKLSVHRNTREQRARHSARNALKRDVKSHLSGDVAGFVVVTWNKNCDAEATWLANRTMPGDVVPEFVKRTLVRCIAKHDAKDAIWGPEDAG